MFRRIAIIFLCLAALLLGRTGPAEAENSSLPLWHADVPHLANTESLHIDFTDSKSYGHLGDGWHDPLGRTHVLGAKKGVGAQSISADLNLRVYQPRDFTLHLRMLPRHTPEYGKQRVIVGWNGNQIGVCEFDIDKAWSAQDFAFEVPQRHVQKGINKLQFFSRFATSSLELGTDKDPRSFAFALHRVLLQSDDSSESVQSSTVEFGDEFILQPANSELVFPMKLPAAETVTFLADRIDGPATLAFRWDGVGRTETYLASDNKRAKCSPPSDQPFSIVLVAGDEAVRWTRPRVEHSPGPSESNRAKSTGGRAAVDNVILVIFDALRGDRVGYAPYPRNTTPYLDSLAERGHAFTRAYSAASYTYSSTWSLLTGLYPFQHRATALPHKPAPSLARLPSWLSEHGIRTGCVAANPYLSPGTGILDSFEFYESGLENLPQANKVPKGVRYRDALDGDPSLVTNAAKAFVEENKNDRFFLYAHYRQPHSPYYAIAPWFQKFAVDAKMHLPPHNAALREIVFGERPLTSEALKQLIARYDENLRVADEELRILWKAVIAAGLADRTALIVTSDHGESFMENGILTHSKAAYNGEVHIPLMVLPPKQVENVGQRIDAVASTVDLFPTISSLLGIDPPEDLPGRDLLAAPPVSAQGTVRAIAQADPASTPWEGFFFDRYKIVRNRFRHGVELYDLSVDPDEEDDLAQTFPVLTEYLLAQALVWQSSMALDTTGDAQEESLDSEIVDQLEALGYVD